MSQKLVIFTLLVFLSIYTHPVYAVGNEFGYDNWPGKNGVTKTNIELPVAPFIKYGTLISKPIMTQLIRLTIQPEIPVSDPKVMGGEIKIYVYPSIEEAQSQLNDQLYSFQNWSTPKRLADSSIGDVIFSYDAFDGKYRCFYFTRSNVVVQILYVSITYQNALDELPAIIDSAIINAPAWKQGDPEPQLKISDEFKKAFQASPR